MDPQTGKSLPDGNKLSIIVWQKLVGANLLFEEEVHQDGMVGGGGHF